MNPVGRLRLAGPAQRLTLLRRLVGGYGAIWVLGTAKELRDLGALDPVRFRPVGILRVTGLGPLTPGLVDAALIACFVAALAMVAGRVLRVSSATFAVGLLVLTTYQNSWGKLLHTENLLVMHAIVLATVPWPRRGAPDGDDDNSWAITAMALATVLGYLAAGVSKLRHGGVSWMTAENLGNWIAYDLTRKELFGDFYMPFAVDMLDRRWLLATAAVSTVVIEIAAPLALIHRRVALGWAVAVWSMHVGILAVMAVAFPYHLTGIAVLPVVLTSAARRPILTGRRRSTMEPARTPTSPHDRRPHRRQRHHHRRGVRHRPGR